MVMGNPTRSMRTGLSVSDIRLAMVDHLRLSQGRLPKYATNHDWYRAMAYVVRDRVLDRCLATVDLLSDTYTTAKLVAYLSAEYLIGPQLGNNLINLGIWNEAEEAVASLGRQLHDLLDEEEEPGLGNGGLGRLAACYMDSLASLQVPAVGYGIRYEFGIFDQAIVDGWQSERTDKWLQFGNPWEVVRSDVTVEVPFGGHTERYRDGEGRDRIRWRPSQVVKGIAHDTVVAGYRVPTTNLLRLWKAEAIESFDFKAFNTGDYFGAVEQKIASETISKVLYPNDEPAIGKRLRLAQQFFFVSCSLQDMIRIHLLRGKHLDEFDVFWAAQLNDTHPAIAIAELMRLLVDEHGMDWDQAWTITQRTCGYTNHTLLPEALEKWSLPMFQSLLPRPLEIIYEINRRFLDEVRVRVPVDGGLVRRLSIIDEEGERAVRMAHLACVGSHAINGVAALHTDLLKQTVLNDFYSIWPDRFMNVTNGVTPRRWMLLGNPALSALITRKVGEGWVMNPERDLPQLEPLASDAAFQQEWRAIKAENKQQLATVIAGRAGIAVDPESLFDVQVKRIHEYKRQHLNALYLVALYNRLREGRADVPRTMVFAGKAAPGYRMAKLMIRLVTGIADVVNADSRIAGRLRVVFLPDFNVSVAQRIYPAADLSEQISTAGKEASGTGNMKFAMNGALTIGTLDGANVEIREAVGSDNFFLFGATADEVRSIKAAGYDPRHIYEKNDELRNAIDMIAGGAFSKGDRDLFRPLVDSLLSRDDYLLFHDFEPYVQAQARVSSAYAGQTDWTRKSILNSARVGRFSSDRSIREYCRDIWGVAPLGPAGSA
jgi:starch phosphorylase